MKTRVQIVKIKTDFEAFVVKMRADINALESMTSSSGGLHAEDDGGPDNPPPAPPDPEPGGPGNGAN